MYILCRFNPILKEKNNNNKCIKHETWQCSYILASRTRIRCSGKRPRCDRAVSNTMLTKKNQ